jgi:hypothetical protein
LAGVRVGRVKLELQNLVEKHCELDRKELRSGWLELRLTSGEWWRPGSRAERGAMARKRNGVDRGGKKLLLLNTVV